MIDTRPTREQILDGIGFEPLTMPGVPEDVCAIESEALQDYLVAWTQGAWDHVTAYERDHGKAAVIGDLTKHSYGCTLFAIPAESESGRLMAELRGSIAAGDLAGQGLEPHAHVTVRFGVLPNANLNDLRRYLRSLEPFEVAFGCTSTFPPSPQSGDAAVVKVDVSSPTLEEINAAIAQHCAFKPANFEYQPHATVAFVNPDIAFKYIADDRLEGKTLEVSAITIAMPGAPDEIVPLLGEWAPWHEPTEKLAKYSDDQPRDERGRFAGGGGGGASHPKSLAAALKIETNKPNVRAAVKGAIERMEQHGMPSELAHACGQVTVIQDKPQEVAQMERKIGMEVGGVYKDSRIWLGKISADEYAPGIALHEYGHHIEEKIRTAAVQKAMGWDREAFKASALAAQKECRSFKDTDDPSFEYAASNIHEWHAEAFRFYHSDYTKELKAIPATHAFWRGVMTGNFTVAKAGSVADAGRMRLTACGQTKSGLFYDCFEGGFEGAGPAGGEKLAKRTPEPEILQAQQKMEADVAHFLRRTAKEIADHFRGLDHEKLAKAAAAVPRIQWDDLVPDLFGSLNTIARTRAGKAIAELKINDQQMLSDVNGVAADWADARACEMVGMKRLANGKLGQNPDAQWTISDKTRDDLKQIVTDAFEQKTSMSDLADAIEQAGAFSEYRAHLIAATETKGAMEQGNLEGWKASGMVEMVGVALSDDHDDKSDCECTALAEGGPYPISQAPRIPYDTHPGCECSLIVAQLSGQDEPEED